MVNEQYYGSTTQGGVLTSRTHDGNLVFEFIDETRFLIRHLEKSSDSKLPSYLMADTWVSTSVTGIAGQNLHFHENPVLFLSWVDRDTLDPEFRTDTRFHFTLQKSGLRGVSLQSFDRVFRGGHGRWPDLTDWDTYDPHNNLDHATLDMTDGYSGGGTVYTNKLSPLAFRYNLLSVYRGRRDYYDTANQKYQSINLLWPREPFLIFFNAVRGEYEGVLNAPDLTTFLDSNVGLRDFCIHTPELDTNKSPDWFVARYFAIRNRLSRSCVFQKASSATKTDTSVQTSNNIHVDNKDKDIRDTENIDTLVSEFTGLIFGETNCDRYMSLWCPSRVHPHNINQCACINPVPKLDDDVIIEVGLTANQEMCFDANCWTTVAYRGGLVKNTCSLRLCSQAVDITGKSVFFQGTQQLNCGNQISDGDGGDDDDDLDAAAQAAGEKAEAEAREKAESEGKSEAEIEAAANAAFDKAAKDAAGTGDNLPGNDVPPPVNEEVNNYLPTVGIVVAAAVVLIIGVIVYYLYVRRSRDKDDRKNILRDSLNTDDNVMTITPQQQQQQQQQPPPLPPQQQPLPPQRQPPQQQTYYSRALQNRWANPHSAYSQ